MQHAGWQPVSARNSAAPLPVDVPLHPHLGPQTLVLSAGLGLLLTDASLIFPELSTPGERPGPCPYMLGTLLQAFCLRLVCSVSLTLLVTFLWVCECALDTNLWSIP